MGDIVMSDGHIARLTYAMGDDGVIIECSCGWRHLLGWSAKPTDATDAQAGHMAEVAAQVDRFLASTPEGVVVRALSNFLGGDALELATEDVLVALAEWLADD